MCKGIYMQFSDNIGMLMHKLFAFEVLWSKVIQGTRVTTEIYCNHMKRNIAKCIYFNKEITAGPSIF